MRLQKATKGQMVEPREAVAPHILLTTSLFCLFQVEISYPTHAYCNILPNATLERLYKNNAEALGIEFPEQPDNFAGGWKSHFQTKRRKEMKKR